MGIRGIAKIIKVGSDSIGIIIKKNMIVANPKLRKGSFVDIELHDVYETKVLKVERDNKKMLKDIKENLEEIKKSPLIKTKKFILE